MRVIFCDGYDFVKIMIIRRIIRIIVQTFLHACLVFGRELIANNVHVRPKQSALRRRALNTRLIATLRNTDCFGRKIHSSL